jgi:hypothetical protein
LDPARLFGVVERSTPALLRTSDAVGRVPGVGRHLKRFVPVANYRGQLPLSEDQLREWAVLDTFDWLAPAYDQPQTAATLSQWLAQAGLEDVTVFKADHLTARGRRPPLDARRD